jgi:hypothetical protein
MDHTYRIAKITDTGKAYLVTNYKRMFKEFMQGKWQGVEEK